MEKQALIDEFSELLNIPRFERILHHKIQELKVLLEDEITLYKNLKHNFQKTAFGNFRICEDEDEIRGFTYRFELNRNEDGDWVPTEIFPSPPSGHNSYDVIPREIIKYISGFKPNPWKIEKRKKFSLPTLEGRNFDLSFTRCAHHHALGTICEIKEKKIREPGSVKNIININDSYKNEPEGGNYKELIFYMEKFPSFKAHIFSEFFMKWKPLIDNQMIETPSK